MIAPPHGTGEESGAAVRHPGLYLDDVTVGYRRSAAGHSRHIVGGTRRHGVPVLSGLTVGAVPGTVTVLLGPNGAGKSTLLRTVAGLQPLLSGRVTVDGVDLRRMGAQDRARKVAVVLTDRFDAGLLTGRDVVALGRHPHLGGGGRLTAEDRDVIDEALAVMHAADLAGTRLAEMSDGQRQRIMVARALAQRTTMLILDEPTAFLDGPARTELLARICEIAASRRIVVLLSTHDVESALRTGGEGWIVAGGRLLAAGRIERLVADGAIGAAFDTPAVCFDPIIGGFTLRPPDHTITIGSR